MDDNASFLLTSGSVSEGRSDKVCDQILDALPDTFLAAIPAARVGLETPCTKDRVILAGEVRGPGKLDHPALAEIARRTVRDIGYDLPGFDRREAEVVPGRLRAELARARTAGPRPGRDTAALAERDRRAVEALLSWPG